VQVEELTLCHVNGLKPKRSKYGYDSYQYEYKKEEKDHA